MADLLAPLSTARLSADALWPLTHSKWTRLGEARKIAFTRSFHSAALTTGFPLRSHHSVVGHRYKALSTLFLRYSESV
jgi:hypothetical protein